jgi:hypothetical protein
MAALSTMLDDGGGKAKGYSSFNKLGAGGGVRALCFQLEDAFAWGTRPSASLPTGGGGDPYTPPPTSPQRCRLMKEISAGPCVLL